jgi:hypothetical protein
VKNDHVKAVEQMLVHGTSIRTAAHVEGEIEFSKTISLMKTIVEIALGTVSHIAKDIHLRPYKIGHVQELLPQDPASRLRFSTWCLDQMRNDPDFQENLIITDESHCFLKDNSNAQNNRKWCFQNPHVAAQVPLHSPKVCGLF